MVIERGKVSVFIDKCLYILFNFKCLFLDIVGNGSSRLYINVCLWVCMCVRFIS